MKLVIVAERTIRSPHLSIVAMVAQRVLRDPGAEIAIRATSAGEPSSEVELAMIEVARICGAGLVMHRPLDGKSSRAGIFHRDYELVTGADQVIAFFSEGSDMGGGTGHVVKAAIDREVAVEAYSVTGEGQLAVLIDGSWGDSEE